VCACKLLLPISSSALEDMTALSSRDAPGPREYVLKFK